MGRSPQSATPTQSDFTVKQVTENDRFNSLDAGEDQDKVSPFTLDYEPDDYVEEDEYGQDDDEHDFVINNTDLTFEELNGLEEKVRSNVGGPDRSKKTQAFSNSLGNTPKKPKNISNIPSNNQQRRPSFTSPRPPLSPISTTTFFIVNSSPTPSFISTTAAPPPTTTTKGPSRFAINQIDDLTSSGGTEYDPCTELNACGPNAICIARGTDPVCSCPLGFSGIPRNGVPDPSHGCVRTPQKVTKIIIMKLSCLYSLSITSITILKIVKNVYL